MKLQVLYFDLTQQLIAEDVPENIAQIIGRAVGQKDMFDTDAFYGLTDAIAGKMTTETGLSVDEVQQEIDLYLMDQGREQWFNTVPKPKREPTIPPERTIRPPTRPKRPGSDIKQHDWETVWHDTLDTAYDQLNYFRPSDLWGRDVSEYFPDKEYFVFDVGGDDGWYTIAAPQTRTSAGRESSGGLGLYIIAKTAQVDVPQLDIRVGQHAKEWFPRILSFMANSEDPTEYDSPYWKVTLRNILIKTGLGRQTSRNEKRNDRVIAAFDPSYATNFAELGEIWGSDLRFGESIVPPKWRQIIEAVAKAMLLTKAAVH